MTRAGKRLASLVFHLIVVATCVAPAAARDAQHPRDGEIRDPDTVAWWHTTEALSGDSMEGRDTGSAAYQRAADYVAARFKEAGLVPAGDAGGYFQTVTMHEIAAVPHGTHFKLSRPDSVGASLEFLQEITLTPTQNFPTRLEAALTFRGYCGKDAMADIAGKVVVCFGTQRTGLPGAAARAAAARDGHALGLINVDDPYFTIEPPRWPAAYARTVTLRPLVAGPAARPAAARDAGPAAARVSAPPAAPAAAEHAEPFASMRLSTKAFSKLLFGTGQDASALLKAGGAQQPLPNFEIGARLQAQVHLVERDISSPNVLAVLPGADPKLRNEYVVASAHLDGYGFGTAVGGDKLYNGTLDDAAYVALLIQMADDIKAHKLPAPQRSLLLAAFTGEEKGLLGSNWFVEHPTLPLPQLAANVNLDQLRPLFPLDILTAEALDDTSLGNTARTVAAGLQIKLRTDVEPERNLLRRADQHPFLVKHVPAISFIFGYDPGTESERRYREWYRVRYHRPQDDLTQPMDFTAATKFNEFFYRLVEAIANDPKRPEVLPGSQFARKN